MRILLIYRAKNDSHTTSYKFVCRYTHVYMKVARSGLSLIPHSCFRCEKKYQYHWSENFHRNFLKNGIINRPNPLSSEEAPAGYPSAKSSKNRKIAIVRGTIITGNAWTSRPRFLSFPFPSSHSRFLFPSFQPPYDTKERGLNRLKRFWHRSA